MENSTIQFIGDPIPVAIEGSLYSYHFALKTPEDGALQVSVSKDGRGLPDWLEFSDLGNGHYALTGIPSKEDVDEFDIKITAIRLSDDGHPQEKIFPLRIRGRDTHMTHTNQINAIRAELRGSSRSETVQQADAGSVITNFESMTSAWVAVVGISSLSSVTQNALGQTQTLSFTTPDIELLSKPFTPDLPSEQPVSRPTRDLSLQSEEITQQKINLNQEDNSNILIDPNLNQPMQEGASNQQTPDTESTTAPTENAEVSGDGEGDSDAEGENSNDVLSTNAEEIPLIPLFGEGDDTVDFNELSPDPFEMIGNNTSGAGNDQVTLPDTNETAVLFGYDPTLGFDAGPGDDVINGGALDDIIFGGSGNDLLSGGLGNDALDGQEGFDTVSFADIPNGIAADLASNTVSNASTDTLANMEAIVGTSFNDTFSLNQITNPNAESVVLSGSNFDSLYGNSTYGADYAAIDGGLGSDSLLLGPPISTTELGDITVGYILVLDDPSLQNIETVTGSALPDVFIASDDLVFSQIAVDGAGSNNPEFGNLVYFAPNILGGVSFSLADVANINQVVGTLSADTIVGDEQNNFIFGLSGSDTLLGLGGDDQLQTTAGAADSILLDGGTGNDSLLAQAGNMTLIGGDGDDNIDAANGIVSITAGEGNDFVGLQAASGSVDTGPGNDGIGTQNMNGLTTISTGPGEDMMIIGAGDYFIDSGADADSIELENGSNGTVNSGLGDDFIRASSVGNYTLSGGDGFDTLSYSFSLSPLTVDLTTGNITKGANSDLIEGIDSIRATPFSDTFLVNDVNSLASFNAIIAEDFTTINDNLTFNGVETINGVSGNDTLQLTTPTTFIGSTDLPLAHVLVVDNPNLFSIETIIGTEFNEIFLVNDYNAISGITLDGGPLLTADDVNILYILPSASGVNINFTEFTNINQIITTDDSDTIVGDANDNGMDSRDGNDFILGGGGDDTITAGDGNHSINGQDGNDSIDVGVGDSDISGGPGNDQILSSGSLTLTVITDLGGNNFISTNSGPYDITLGDGNDIVQTNNGENQIVTGAGADSMNLTGGNNTVETGADNDSVSASGAGTNVINLGPGDDEFMANSGNNAVFGDTGNDNLNAGEGNDELRGGFGDDTLVGQLGNDFLDGGPGVDAINGGRDFDRIIFDAADSSVTGGFGNSQFGIVTNDDNGVLAGTGDILEITVNASFTDPALSFSGFEAIHLNSSSGALALTLSEEILANFTQGRAQTFRVTNQDTIFNHSLYFNNGELTDTGDAVTIDGRVHNEFTLNGVFGSFNIFVDDSINVVGPVFTASDDVVNFNTDFTTLTDADISALEPTNAFAGFDTVTLPDSGVFPTVDFNQFNGGLGFIGGPGIDQIFGGDRDDAIGIDDFLPGNSDSVDGGAGIDTVNLFVDYFTPVTIDTTDPTNYPSVTNVEILDMSGGGLSEISFDLALADSTNIPTTTTVFNPEVRDFTVANTAIDTISGNSATSSATANDLILLIDSSDIVNLLDTTSLTLFIDFEDPPPPAPPTPGTVPFPISVDLTWIETSGPATLPQLSGTELASTPFYAYQLQAENVVISEFDPGFGFEANFVDMLNRDIFNDTLYVNEQLPLV